MLDHIEHREKTVPKWLQKQIHTRAHKRYAFKTLRELKRVVCCVYVKHSYKTITRERECECVCAHMISAKIDSSFKIRERVREREKGGG